MTPILATRLPGVGAQHADLAAGAAPIAFEDLHGAGLAGAVGTEQGEQLATEHLEAKPGEGLAFAVAHPQIADADDGLAWGCGPDGF
jgi:hypothetical protein